MIKPLTAKRWKAAGLNPNQCGRLFDSMRSLITLATDEALSDWSILGAQIIERLTRPRGKPSQEKTRQRILHLIKEVGLRSDKPSGSSREFIERTTVGLAYDVLSLLPRRSGRRSRWSTKGIIHRAMLGANGPDPHVVTILALHIQRKHPGMMDKLAILEALTQIGVGKAVPEKLERHYTKRFSDVKRGRRR